MSIKNNYNHTLNACYIGYITQAIVNNFAPLLFLTFQRSYGISLGRITFLVTLNFGIQLLVDLISTRFADRIGYRTCMVFAHVSAGLGLIAMAALPEIMENRYAGLLISVILYAIGGGLLEVLVSPIVEACPTKRKEAAMSLLHSFYCWGYMGVVLLSTLFFSVLGIGNWRLISLVWAAVPLANAVYFTKVPIRALTQNGEGLGIRRLAGMKSFWLLMLLMVCAGASEQAVSQWASAFAESGLKVDKIVGDLAGPCTFAALMGTARILTARFSEKVDLNRIMAGSGILCVISYLMISCSANPVTGLIGCALCGFSVGAMWPGTFSIAMRKIPTGGTAMFALFALAGDLGCSGGPALVGFVSGFGSADHNLRQGILAAVIFPVLLLWGLWAARSKDKIK